MMHFYIWLDHHLLHSTLHSQLPYHVQHTGTHNS
uniref:Uncharacterized protein n=1 Tax=Anguilla anguilla TaxID=7936 RepID=A0A0E9RZ31_ANGAN